MNCKLCESGFDFTMIGGNSETIIFEAVNEYMNDVDINECTASFSICRYDERHSDCATKMSDVVIGGNTVTVKLRPDDTIDLSGKYIWQLSIYSSERAKLANTQGNLFIVRNIDKNYTNASLGVE